MTWLKLALLLLQVARLILERGKDAELIQSGKTAAKNEQLELEVERIKIALDARRAANTDSLQNDGYRRD